MQRSSHSHLVALFGAFFGVLAIACVAIGDVNAQVAAPDPLTPKLNTDPRNPPKFQKFTRPEQTPLGAPTRFAPTRF